MKILVALLVIIISITSLTVTRDEVTGKQYIFTGSELIELAESR